MVGLVESRDKMLASFKQGGKPSCAALKDYRKKRNSEMWRLSRHYEELMEYILYLESELEKRG